MRSASGAWLFFAFFAPGAEAALPSFGFGRASSSEADRFVPFTGWVEKGGGGGFAEVVCCVELKPLRSGDEPEGCSFRVADLFAAGVEKKVAVLDLAWVGGGEGSSMKDLHSESRCLLMLLSLTGLSHIGHCTIGSSGSVGDDVVPIATIDKVVAALRVRFGRRDGKFGVTSLDRRGASGFSPRGIYLLKHSYI